MTRTPFLVRALVLCFALCCSASCSTKAQTQPEASPSTPVALELPSRVLGLTVRAEDITERLKSASQPYVDSAGLFGFRERADLLDATLEVAKFTAAARVSSPDFQGSIVSRIGGTTPRRVRVGDKAVYLTAGRNQVVFIWFTKHSFLVLTVRRDYPFPRTLLRHLLALDVGA